MNSVIKPNPEQEQIAELQQEVRLLQQEVKQFARMKRLWQQSNERLVKAREKQLDLQKELEGHIDELEQARSLLETIASNDKAIIENMAEGVMITSPDGIIRQVNPAFETITGYLAEQAIGRNAAMLASGEHETEFFSAMWNELKQHSIWKGEVHNRNAQGEIYIQETSISAVKDWNGDIINYVAVMQDVTQRRRDDERLRELALYDNLTGLANRRLFFERLNTILQMAHRSDISFAVLFIDLDGFKPVNDWFGHDAGDYVLSEFANRLRGLLRESDVASRFGGDEFTLLLSVIDSVEDAQIAANRLLKELQKPMLWKGEEINIGASIGVALYPQDGDDDQSLVKVADARMYRAKHQGKGTICVSDE